MGSLHERLRGFGRPFDSSGPRRLESPDRTNPPERLVGDCLASLEVAA